MESNRQVALADVLIANKVDLVSCEVLAELESRLRYDGMRPTRQGKTKKIKRKVGW